MIAPVLTILLPLLTSKGKQGTITKGDNLIYSAVGTVGNKPVHGVIGIKVVAVKENEFIVEVLPKSVPFMNRARLTFPGNGDDLSDLGGIIAGWSVNHEGEWIATEVLATPFGEKDVEHYMRIQELENGTLKIDQFVDPVHHLPIGVRLSGKSGDVLFGILETSMEWVKEGKKR
jgi:hypothetical protein